MTDPTDSRRYDSARHGGGFEAPLEGLEHKGDYGYKGMPAM
jgi:hypothetical protein